MSLKKIDRFHVDVFGDRIVIKDIPTGESVEIWIETWDMIVKFVNEVNKGVDNAS